MSDVIATTRALLRMLEKSGYADLHLRQDDYELFISKRGAAANPMRRAVASPDTQTAPGAPSVEVTAPHVATLLSALPLGSAVVAGSTVVARLGLLDEVIEITAEQGGTVAEIPAQVGALLDYAAPILRLVPA